MFQPKQILKIIFITLFFSTYSFTQNISELDSIPKFRNFNWGEKIKNVEAQETAHYAQTYIGFGEYILSYYGNILDFEAMIDYTFKDSVLIEGSYTIQANNFSDTFNKVKEFYINKLGKPNYWASAYPDSSFQFKNTSEAKQCRGPELYWEYCNGFIGIISEKYEDEITITILYAYNKTIADYGKFLPFPREYYPMD